MGSFPGFSLTIDNCQSDICPGNICPGDICPGDICPSLLKTEVFYRFLKLVSWTSLTKQRSYDYEH